MASSSEEESNNNDHEMLSENSEDASVDATKGALKVAVSEVGGYKRTSKAKNLKQDAKKKPNPKTSSSRKTALSNFSEEESNNSDQEMLSENSEDASVDATQDALKVSVKKVGGYKRTSKAKNLKQDAKKKTNPKTSSSRKKVLFNFSDEESNNSDHEMLSENSEDASVDATQDALKVSVREVGAYKRTSKAKNLKQDAKKKPNPKTRSSRKTALFNKADVCLESEMSTLIFTFSKNKFGKDVVDVKATGEYAMKKFATNAGQIFKDVWGNKLKELDACPFCGITNEDIIQDESAEQLEDETPNSGNRITDQDEILDIRQNDVHTDQTLQLQNVRVDRHTVKVTQPRKIRRRLGANLQPARKLPVVRTVTQKVLPRRKVLLQLGPNCQPRKRSDSKTVAQKEQPPHANDGSPARHVNSPHPVDRSPTRNVASPHPVDGSPVRQAKSSHPVDGSPERQVESSHPVDNRSPVRHVETQHSVDSPTGQIVQSLRKVVSPSVQNVLPQQQQLSIETPAAQRVQQPHLFSPPLGPTAQQQLQVRSPAPPQIQPPRPRLGNGVRVRLPNRVQNHLIQGQGLRQVRPPAISSKTINRKFSINNGNNKIELTLDVPDYLSDAEQCSLVRDVCLKKGLQVSEVRLV